MKSSIIAAEVPRASARGTPLTAPQRTCSVKLFHITVCFSLVEFSLTNPRAELYQTVELTLLVSVTSPGTSEKVWEVLS